ncbi:unnamed protein product [Pseudo-nitzschia multistriata]|uniref:ABC transmembrane type-1 domain-containing protein n=1 Tax=Pseudo-nitzschia multistriata TaxID=183589 RepID=A0A448Z492_9STRA|nr:unnamed protein product [Pseudo-nitzschia multistriata]
MIGAALLAVSFALTLPFVRASNDWMWIETHHYTGERRGLPSNDSYLSRRRLEKETSIGRDKTISDTSYDFPFQSADIGSSSSSRDIGSKQHQRQAFPSETESGRRNFFFPIDFRRQKGRLNVGFSFGDDDGARKRGQRNRPPRRKSLTNGIKDRSFPPMSIVSGNSTTIPPAMASGGDPSEGTTATTALVEKTNHALEKRRATSATLQHGDAFRARSNYNDSNVELSLSLDPFSLASLVRNLVASSVGAGSVYVGTLKLLGPMILAKQCLASVGYAFYDYYSGRYLPQKQQKRVRCVQEYELIAAGRAALRSLLQFLCMGLVGQVVRLVLDPHHRSCTLGPPWPCHLWYGVVWLASVCAAGCACEEWGFDFLAKKTGNRFAPSSLSVLSTATDAGPRADFFFSSKHHVREDCLRGRRKRNVVGPQRRFVKGPSRDPENWLKSIMCILPDREDPIRPRQSGTNSGICRKVSGDVDVLLFPSVWKPLKFVMFLAFTKAIYESFSDSPLRASESGKLDLVLRTFVLQQTLHSEWHRLFVQERMLSLGACVSVIGLVALIWSLYAVSIVDRTAALLLTPFAAARLITSYVNFLVSFDRSTFIDNGVAFS